ncbi:MAG TPA: YceH family protein [Chitinispirillaceae bacterium]|nr:YceH family protein [Chitinispirillaceae bacterium]
MNIDLNDHELRILGSLIEKEITTPEYYPLSLNALMAACNQKSNREPVMNLTESEISEALMSLRDKKLVWQLSTAGGRVPKFEHNLRSLFSFSKAETAILCVLMLRGAQTAGEIKGRAERIYSFSSLQEVEASLQQLSVQDGGPFVKELPRQPGKKEPRFIHLFSTQLLSSIESTAISSAEMIVTRTSNEDRFANLEQEVKQLREELDILKSAFAELKKQFE